MTTWRCLGAFGTVDVFRWLIVSRIAFANLFGGRI